MSCIDEADDSGGGGLGPEIEDRRDYGLDSTLAGTFPCSDPLSSIPNRDLERRENQGRLYQRPLAQAYELVPLSHMELKP